MNQRLSVTQSRTLRRLVRLARKGGERQRRRAAATHLLFQVQNGVRSPAEALGLKPSDTPGYVRFAAHLLEHGRDEDALASAEVAIALDTNNASAWLVLGCSAARLGQMARALVCYGHAAHLDPNNVRVWTDMAELYLGTLDFAKAAECLERAIELDPDARTPAGKRAFVLVAKTYYGGED